ncbi:MAG: hypothetical protein WCA89_12480, partial [Terracidiphilus sp.]
MGTAKKKARLFSASWKAVPFQSVGGWPGLFLDFVGVVLDPRQAVPVMGPERNWLPKMPEIPGG